MREISSAVITGPTGVIGSSLCRLLINNGIRVYAAVRRGCKRLDNLPVSPLLETVECDISELASLKDSVGKADSFFHLAWKSTRFGRNDMTAQTENIQYTIDAAKTAAALGSKVFVGAGSQAEYGICNTPLSPDTPCFPITGYGAAKHCAGIMTRLVCENMGIDHVWLRILSVYGKYEDAHSMISGVIDTLLDGNRPSLTGGGQVWDYLYCEDAAKAVFAAALKGKNGAVYPVGSGTTRHLSEYVEILRDTIDPALPLGFGEIPYSPNQVMHLEADISALTRDTGFVPEVSFEDGIKRTIDWRRSIREQAQS